MEQKLLTCEANASISVAGRTIAVLELDNLEHTQNWKMKNNSLHWVFTKCLPVPRSTFSLSHFSCLDDPGSATLVAASFSDTWSSACKSVGWTSIDENWSYILFLNHCGSSCTVSKHVPSWIFVVFCIIVVFWIIVVLVSVSLMLNCYLCHCHMEEKAP